MADAVLVTGATGFIGTHLVQALRDAGCAVVTHSRADGDIAHAVLDGDGIGHVVHLAGRSYVPDSWTSPRPFYEVNVLGTINVLELCRRRSLGLTYVSSYVYGVPRELPIHEDHPVAAFNPYSHSKLLAEDAISYFTRQFGLRASVIRPFNVYGAGQDERFLIPTLVRQALDPATDRITVRDLRPRRDFIHVLDLVSLLVATVLRPSPGVFNAASGRSVGIAELVEEINAAAGSVKSVVSSDEPRPDEVFDVVGDISRAKRELAWQPRVGLREGLTDTVQWARNRLAATR